MNHNEASTNFGTQKESKNSNRSSSANDEEMKSRFWFIFIHNIIKSSPIISNDLDILIFNRSSYIIGNIIGNNTLLVFELKSYELEIRQLIVKNSNRVS